MFTGLIQTTGSILSIEKREGSQRIAISAPLSNEFTLRTGDSVAVSGVCLTALDIDPRAQRFHADLAAETVARTSLATLAPGSIVNLELPTPAGSPLGGHVVQGHVDGTGTLLSLKPVEPNADPALTDWWLTIAIPTTLARYMVEKGSIAIEGISLTIARWEPATTAGDLVHVAIIPHTYAKTNLHTLRAGQPVNLEADVFVKYMEQRAKQGAQEPTFDLTLGYLIANGY
jgi:riboflavin synthase